MLLALNSFASGLFQAKQNYERELLLHATDIENLAQVKQEVSSAINQCLLFLYL